tara:strand:+ start:366 stop:623 length:258 start_codon:yes stop_codon:yes gene_type:complete
VLVTAAVTETAMANLTFAGFVDNIVMVTLGNILGGSVLVALVYYVIYIRPQRKAQAPITSKSSHSNPDIGGTPGAGNTPGQKGSE